MDTKKEKNKRDHIYIQNNVLNCDNRLIQKISCAVNMAFPEGTMKMIKIISGISKSYGAISLKMCQ